MRGPRSVPVAGHLLPCTRFSSALRPLDLRASAHFSGTLRSRSRSHSSAGSIPYIPPKVPGSGRGRRPAVEVTCPTPTNRRASQGRAQPRGLGGSREVGRRRNRGLRRVIGRARCGFGSAVGAHRREGRRGTGGGASPHWGPSRYSYCVASPAPDFLFLLKARPWSARSSGLASLSGPAGRDP